MVSYVGSSQHADQESAPADSDGHEALRIGAAAVEHVLAFEAAMKRTAHSMPHNNPGYDVVSSAGDETRYIEVKGIDGAWNSLGVAISQTQYQHALAHGDNFWLYIVEHARGPAPALIHRLREPIRLITEFRFDHGWRHRAETSASPLRGKK